MPSAFLHPFTSPKRDEFVTIVRGRDAAVFDDQGNACIDVMASLWYCNVGRGREEIADAVAEQARTLAAYHAFDPFTNEPAEAAAVIAELSPLDDARVFFGSSGSEAVDTATKIARIAHRKDGHPVKQIIVSRERGYHGTNYGGTSIQGIAPTGKTSGSWFPTSSTLLPMTTKP
jgi:putrescine aminotransferase